MKTLSVKQPWAYLLCSGIKDIENRTWKLPEKYKGERVLIHASAKSDNFWDKPQPIWKMVDGINRKIDVNNYESTTGVFSAIIGSIRFIDCTMNHPSIWAEKSTPIELDEFGFPIKYDKKIYNWVVADPILFDNPILNVKGKLRFWDYDLGRIAIDAFNMNR